MRFFLPTAHPQKNTWHWYKNISERVRAYSLFIGVVVIEIRS